MVTLAEGNSHVSIAGYAYSGIPPHLEPWSKIGTASSNIYTAKFYARTCLSSAQHKYPEMPESRRHAGAGRKIIRCEVSMDGAKTWQLAEIHRACPPNAYGKHWAWVHWTLRIPLCEPYTPQVI